MVRVREDKNISMLDVYSRALRPALSIRKAATAIEPRRTKPTMAAPYLADTETQIWSLKTNSMCFVIILEFQSQFK